MKKEKNNIAKLTVSNMIRMITSLSFILEPKLASKRDFEGNQDYNKFIHCDYTFLKTERQENLIK